MDTYILALDQGTTSSRAILFDGAGRAVSVSQKPFSQFYPKPGWVEHDPLEIWSSQIGAARDAIAAARVSPSQIAGIGIANQRETAVFWDRKTGDPVGPAIVWQDRRTAEICRRLSAEGLEKTVVERTGLLLDPYFSSTKIMWVLESDAGIRARAMGGDICFGTVDSWLLQQAHREAPHGSVERLTDTAFRHPQGRMGSRARLGTGRPACHAAAGLSFVL